MSSRVLSGSTMACPSSSSTATAWKTKAICDSASKISCNFNNPSSMFLFLSSIPNRHNKPLRFTACSLDPSSSSSCSTSSAPSSSSSSSSSWSTYYAATCRHVRSKCTENERIHDVGFSIIKKAKAHNSLKVASKWVARKRPLWRKFWFASKKMRSIILLNVITVVYGITITYLALSAKLFEMLTVLGQNNENYIDCRNVDVFINENVDVSVTTICSKKSAEVPSSMTVFVIYHTSDIPVVKGVETSMDPASFSAVRFVMSAIPFLPFVFHARDDFKTRNAGMELGLWVSLGYLMEAIGLLTADAGRASFISLFTVIVVPLLDGILGAMVPARTWFGVLMSVLGVAMLECSGSPPIVGDLLNFLSAIFFGIHMLRTEHISRSTKKEKFLPLLGYEVCVVALLSTIWASVGGWFDPVHGFNQSSWTWTDLQDWIVTFPWIPALYTGVFSTGLCLWIEIAAMRDVSATETAIIYGLEPLWGAGFAWFLLGERWGTIGWIGAALVLGGSLMVQILGCLPANKSIEAEEGKQKDDFLLVRDKQKMQKGFSTSPVVVSTRKDVIDLFK